jgi:hypothetical protein
MSYSPSLPRPGATGPARALRSLERVAPLGIGAFLFLLPQLFPLGIGRDYPNHLARAFIQSELGGSTALAANYTIEWFLVPDLALDVFALPFAGWLSPYAVGGLFNGLMLVLLFTAALALHRRSGGQGTVWPLLATAVLFNEALRWGFVNFLFACGLALWIVYFWLESARWRPGPRLLVFSLAQLGLFFAHLLGFMLCGYLILTLELVRFWQAKGVAPGRRLGGFVFAMLQFAVPLLLFAYVLFGQGGVGDDSTVYGGLATKALAFLSPTSALAQPFSILILLAILLLFYGALRHRLAVIERAFLPLLAAMGLLVVVMPSMVLGIWGLDFRYPFVVLLLAIAAVRPLPQARGAWALNCAVLAIAAASLAGAAVQFADTHRKQEQLRQAVTLAEPGGALLVAGDYEPGCAGCYPEWIDQLHAASLAAVERQMFVPLLFTATSFVAAAPERHRLDVPYGLPVTRAALLDGRSRALPPRGPDHDPRHPYWHSWGENFDYVIWMRGNDSSLDDVPGLERLAAGEVFVFYRVLRSSPPAAP